MKTIYLTALLFLLCTPFAYLRAAGGELYITPSTGVMRVDEPISIEVRANSDGQKVNAVEADIAYKPADFSVESIDVRGSILTSWSTTPAYDGAAGIIKFSGWTSGTYSGSDGVLITVHLRPLRVTQSSLVFNSGAMLAADGRGSNILTTMTSAAFSISPKQVTTDAPQEAISSVVTEPVDTGVPGEVQNINAPLSAAALESSNQVAALVASGVELAPIVVAFFGLLVLFAFCIAYILHRNGIQKL